MASVVVRAVGKRTAKVVRSRSGSSASGYSARSNSRRLSEHVERNRGPMGQSSRSPSVSTIRLSLRSGTTSQSASTRTFYGPTPSASTASFGPTPSTASTASSRSLAPSRSSSEPSKPGDLGKTDPPSRGDPPPYDGSWKKSWDRWKVPVGVYTGLQIAEGVVNTGMEIATAAETAELFDEIGQGHQGGEEQSADVFGGGGGFVPGGASGTGGSGFASSQARACDPEVDPYCYE